MEEVRKDLLKVEEVELYPIPNYNRYFVNLEEGKVYDTLRERYLVANPNANGYCYTGMYDDQGDYKPFSVHVIVMMAFLYVSEPIWVNSGLEIHHLDNDKSNQSILNLQLVTRAQQYECKITKKSIKNRSTKRLKRDDVIAIKEDLIDWEGSIPDFCRKWGELTGIEYRSIHNIVSGQTYKKVEVV